VDLTGDELEERRWKLVQKRWDNKLTPGERLELRLIESRLNAEERQRTAGVRKQRKKLASDRVKLLSSLERLVNELRNS